MGKLSTDAIRQRAAKFAKQFETVVSEKQHDQEFMRGLCEVFGVNLNRLQWQFRLKDGKKTQWADGVLPGMALFEIKSRGEDLDKAYEQAARYVKEMQDADVPQLIIVSDFERIHVYNNGDKAEILLSELPRNIDALLPLAGYEAYVVQQQNAANERAAERIGKLHDEMKANGYEGADLETYLVRILFCLFADDTGLFGEKDSFLRLLQSTKVDGTDLHGELEALFTVLNQAPEKRPKNLPERFSGFPYVNGNLFAERLSQPYYFCEQSRALLIGLAQEDWSNIDPSIFGSLFQAIMHHENEKAGKSKKRRELGAHYTSEENILKVIKPLFLDELWQEFEKAKNNKRQLAALHDKLASLNFLDPACGCGNFLVVAYRELRLLELALIKRLYANDSGQVGDVSLLARLDVDQFHGIEIDSTAARIAVVAMWLTDHQMNMRLEELGVYYHRLPLVKRANIVCANALQLDWNQVISAQSLHYILGNPPFIGSKMMTPAQRDDLLAVAGNTKGAGVLDYVCGWYFKAVNYVGSLPIKIAFVSTNSITQGEQVAPMWQPILAAGFQIFFAHRTFRWNNEARGVAAVHCVIIGLANSNVADKRLFDYSHVNAEADELPVKRINPYLVEAESILLPNRSKPICDVPDIKFGSMPNDGGHLFVDNIDGFIKENYGSEKIIRKFIGATEFINGGDRWCLWLRDFKPSEIKGMPGVIKRINAVRELRSASRRETTRLLADFPYLFGEIRQPETDYIVIPRHSSERRSFIPIGFVDKDIICGDSNLLIASQKLVHFAVMTSTMHMAWVRTVCGRIKNDYRYSVGIVYNNFPWPEIVEAKYQQAIEKAAQAVLDARAQFPDNSLADLYDPLTMPPALVKAHQQLDKAVDAAYIQAEKAAGKPVPKLGADAERVAFLFELYQRHVARLEAQAAAVKPKAVRKKAAV